MEGNRRAEDIAYLESHLFYQADLIKGDVMVGHGLSEMKNSY
jgi:hypothetical protein